MKVLGTMLPDISRALFQRPATQSYPAVRPPVVERLRGLLQWDPAGCTGCGLCAIDCPSAALQLTMLDRKEKRFYLTYHIDRCLFCGQCVLSCRQGCLRMANDRWELAGLEKDHFTTYFGDREDVEPNLAGKPADPSEPSA